MKLTRREILIGCGSAVAGAASTMAIPRLNQLFHPGQPNLDSPNASAVEARPTELAYLSPVANQNARWGPEELFTFLNAVSEPHLISIGKSLEIEKFGELTKPKRLEEIHRAILWQSSSVFTFPLKSLNDVKYHDLVVWSAKKVGLSEDEARFTATYDLERQIVERQFIDIWDGISKEQRKELLAEIAPSGGLENHAFTVALSGAKAIAALSRTVHFKGFRFYTSMSVMISTVARSLGLTLPFTVYQTASSTVAALSGPIGWAIAAVCVAGAYAAWAGQANARKTTATIMQLHCMKAGSLYCAGA